VEGVIEELVAVSRERRLLRALWRHWCCRGWLYWLGQDMALDAQATQATQVTQVTQATQARDGPEEAAAVRPAYTGLAAGLPRFKAG
jgi:hypothetical protein